MSPATSRHCVWPALFPLSPPCCCPDTVLLSTLSTAVSYPRSICRQTETNLYTSVPNTETPCCLIIIWNTRDGEAKPPEREGQSPWLCCIISIQLTNCNTNCKKLNLSVDNLLFSLHYLTVVYDPITFLWTHAIIHSFSHALGLSVGAAN